MTEISVLSQKEAALLSDIQSATFRQAYKDVHNASDIDQYCRSNFSVAKALSLLRSDTYLCKSIAQNGATAGFYALHFQAAPVSLPGRSAELKQIYVLENSYGAGIGQRLFDDAVMELRARECQWIWLSVSDLNLRAQSFYKKLAFEKVGTGPTFEVGKDRLSSTIMARKV